MKLFRSCALGCLFLFGAPMSWACSCIGPLPACSVYTATDSLFVGQVMEIVNRERPPDQDPGSFSFSSRLVRFSIQERFRGALGSIVEIATGMGGGDCGFPFKVGETYLVYASVLKSGQLCAGICSRTQSLENASADLEFLRSLSSQPPGGTIFGKVMFRDESSQNRQDAPMPAARVDISGPTSAKVLTDAQGNYSFRSLPPGKYAVNFELPKDFLSQSFNISVADRTCSEVNEYASPAGEISGRVLDANGNPVANLMVDLRDDSKPQEPAERRQFDFTHTDHDGYYTFQGVAPGTYMPGVNINFTPEQKAPYARTYYPGLKDDTQPIRLGFGQRFVHADIQLPPKLVEREVQVVVTWPDGSRVKGAAVLVTDSLDMDVRFTPQPSAQNPGAILLLEGEKYYVVASVDSKDHDRKCARAVEVSPSANTEPVKLVIDSKGDQCVWPITTDRS